MLNIMPSIDRRTQSGEVRRIEACLGAKELIAAAARISNIRCAPLHNSEGRRNLARNVYQSGSARRAQGIDSHDNGHRGALESRKTLGRGDSIHVLKCPSRDVRPSSCL